MFRESGSRKRTVMGQASSSPSPVRSPKDPAISVCCVPLEVVEEIFHNLPYGHVIRRCRVVCKEWKELVDSESLWRERCRREGLLPRVKTPNDWRLYYVMCRKRRNLLKNTRAEESLKFWKIILNGGDKWVAEKIIWAHPKPEVKDNFVTSYSMCLKAQTIDLESEGYNSSFMDQFQPPIKITDWYASRCDCMYKIEVMLLTGDKKCVQKFGPQIVYLKEQDNRQWFSVTHVFRNYGPGVRYIHFLHGGKDQIFWAGWYGVRVTDSCVEVCPEDQ